MSGEEKEGCRPINVEETIAQLGGRGHGGALAYTGTRRIKLSETKLRLYVNGRPAWSYYISITVNFDDLYDIEVWGTRGNTKKLLGETSDLYFDDLQGAVERLYNRVMRETNDGWIPL